jgi:hypothetical protein
MLLEKAKNPAFWEKVRTSSAYRSLVDELLSLWEKDCTDVFPAGKYSEYVLFNQTGSRAEYEAFYFRRRRAMNTSALLSLIYPDNDTYFTMLCDVIWVILDEYSWVLPAHIHNFRDCSTKFIDLFAAETGFTLSEIDYLLEDRLPSLIRSRIRAEIDRRIISVYTGPQEFWWEKSRGNWAAVCAGCVGITFLYQRPDLFESIQERIDKTLRTFLTGFYEDGICQEVFHYWHYGFGHYLCFADLIRQFSDGKIDYLAEPKIQTIAQYPQRMFMDGDTIVSFSDSHMKSSWHIGLLHYLKKEFPDHIHLPPQAFSYSNDSCGRWGLHLRAFLWFDETLPCEDTQNYGTDYSSVSQWLIKKTPLYSFAAKGGHNDEPHNHNDIGSFILTKNGEQILCDPGTGTYCREYFSDGRYTFFRTSSRGHSVPIINGQYQKEGRTHEASASFSEDVFTLEMHRAYDIPALRGLTRSFSFTETTVTLRDDFSFDGQALPVVERFISRYPVEITPEGVLTGGLLLSADASAVVTQTEGLYCIDYALEPNATGFTLTVQIG